MCRIFCIAYIIYIYIYTVSKNQKIKLFYSVKAVINHIHTYLYLYVYEKCLCIRKPQIFLHTSVCFCAYLHFYIYMENIPNICWKIYIICRINSVKTQNNYISIILYLLANNTYNIHKCSIYIYNSYYLLPISHLRYCSVKL